MRIYIAPVIYVTTGEIEIEANSLEEAKAIASKLNETLLDLSRVENQDHSSEVFINEIEE